MDGQPQEPRITGVDVAARGVDGPARPHHRRQVPQRGDVADAEHAVQRLVGGLVELGVPVGAAEDGVDPAAQRLAAPLRRGHRQRA